MSHHLEAADVAAMCEGARPSAGGWTARCPIHDDRLASLSIHDGKKGTLIHCHAGCRTVDIAAALGFPMAQLFEDWSPNGPTDSDVNLMLRDAIRKKRQQEPPIANATLGDVMWHALKSGEEAWFRAYAEHAELMDTPFHTAMKMWGIVADTALFTYLEPWFRQQARDWHTIRREAMTALSTAQRERERYAAGY